MKGLNFGTFVIALSIAILCLCVKEIIAIAILYRENGFRWWKALKWAICDFLDIY